jgi:hypothetical protein
LLIADSDFRNSTQITIQDCEIQNLNASSDYLVSARGPAALFFSRNTIRSCYSRDFALDLYHYNSARPIEVLESTFIDTIAEDGLLFTTGSSGIFTNCQFRNMTIGSYGNAELCFVGCDFKEGSAGVTSAFLDLLVTDCHFEDLEVGVASPRDYIASYVQVCGCHFIRCEQGIVGAWMHFTLIQSIFDDLTGEACFWTGRCTELTIDLCSFGAPLQGGLTLSFAADGGGKLEGDNSISRSCFGGLGQRLAFATELSSIKLVIDPTVCFESFDPFGPEYIYQVNDRWNPNIECSDCIDYEVSADDGCERPGLLHPMTLFPTPEGIEQFYTLPPPPTAPATERLIATEIPEQTEVATSAPPSSSPTEHFIPYRPLRYGRFMFLMYTLAW